MSGISLRDKNTQEYHTAIKLPLTKGTNKIQLSALNIAGAESYRATGKTLLSSVLRNRTNER